MKWPQVFGTKIFGTKIFGSGSVWIPFIVENWKYCSKIIFKCVNSVVRPSFIINFAKFCTCRSREQCAGDGIHYLKCKRKCGWISSVSKHTLNLTHNFTTCWFMQLWVVNALHYWLYGLITFCRSLTVTQINKL